MKRAMVAVMTAAVAMMVGVGAHSAQASGHNHKMVSRVDVTNGIVLDAAGNGKVYDTVEIITYADGCVKRKHYGADAEYDYISYSDVKGIHAGDEVMTVDIMSTKNLEADDILNRTDFITDCAAKR